MRRTGGVATAIAALALGLAVPATSQADGTCKRMVDIGPTGADPADAVQIRIRGTTCSVAAKVIRRAIYSYEADSVPVYKGYVCDRNFSARTTCRKGTKRVSFRLG